MSLAAFLLARIAEDKAAVQAATAPGEMHPYGDTSLPEVSIESFPDQVRGYLGGTWGEHCARWSFTRVLAECEAKRRIVDLHDRMHECSVYDHAGEVDNCAWVTGWPCSTLFLVALPYANHPDYLPDWGPTTC